MFLPRCSKHMSVINYLTVHYFPTHIIAPFYRGGTLWPNVCFLKCHQNTFKWSFFFKLFFFSSNMFKWSFFKFFSLQDYTLVSNWDFLLLLTSKMTTLLVMNYCDLHAQDSYHVCPDAKQNSQWKCNKVY